MNVKQNYMIYIKTHYMDFNNMFVIFAFNIIFKTIKIILFLYILKRKYKNHIFISH